MTSKVEATFKCHTVGDLLDALDGIAKDHNLNQLLDASIDGSHCETFVGFWVVRRTLSDGSEVLDFELFQDGEEAEGGAQ